MADLTKEKCIPCKGDTPTLTNEEVERLLKDVPDWKVEEVDGVKHLKRDFSFENFKEALKFTNQVGEAAEEQGHHPVIELTWGRATIEWWTHMIGGLHKNDFIMAAKTSKIYQDF